MKRIKEWDFFKGILIIMIILGHTTAGLGEYEPTPVLEYFSSLTVSFIMPMFLVITGYFIYSFNQKAKTFEYIIKKAKRLLTPALIWGGIGGLISTVSIIISLHSVNTDTVIVFLRNIKYLWYLYATFVCSLIIWSIEKVLPEKSKNIVLISTVVILHLIPTDLWNISFSYSFILLGYYLRKKQFSLKWFDNHINLSFGVLIMYLIMLLFFPYNYSIYIAGTNFITNNPLRKQISIVLFRFVIGILGTISIGWLAHLFYKYLNGNIANWLKRTAETIGVNSLELYCIQFIIIEKFFLWSINWLTQSTKHSFADNPYLCYFLWRHIFGFLLIAITYIIVLFLKTTRLRNYIF